MDQGRPSKKRRLACYSEADDLELFSPSGIISASDVVARSADADTREYIQGQIVMRWTFMRFRLSKLSGSSIAAELQLRGRCAELWDSFGFDIGDILRVSLKGVKIEQTKSAGKLVLVYDDGIAFQYVSRSKKVEDNGKIVNIWTSDRESGRKGTPPRRFADVDDWFSTPSTQHEKAAMRPTQKAAPQPVVQEEDIESTTADVFRAEIAPKFESNSLSQQASVGAVENVLPKPEVDSMNVGATTASLTSAQTDVVDATSSLDAKSAPRADLQSDTFSISRRVPHINEALELGETERTSEGTSTGQETKKAMRARMKMKKRERKALQTTANLAPTHLEEYDLPDKATDSGNAPNTPAIQTREVQVQQDVPSPKSVSFTPSSTKDLMANPGDLALNMRAGFRASTDYYVPLSNAHEHYEFSTIGVVTSASAPEVKGTGDWMTCLTVVDPSNVDLHSGYGFGGQDGFKINCFTKKHQEWLPRPRRGDVLLLRRIKRSTWQDKCTGIGYHDKLRWAIYSSSTGEVHHGDVGEAPRMTALDGGFGADFSPFWDPEEDELQYCIQLADWWQAMEKEQQRRMGTVHQISMVPRFPAGGRQHRLICDCTPDMPPAGFFNCTVEVLHVYHSENGGPHSLYVTDYTKNRLHMPFNTSWCRAEFAEYVLKIEMWDAAKEVCRSMQAGEFYALGNIKYRLGSSGYYEAKGNDAKYVRLGPEDEADQANPHLQALLARKKEYEEKQEPSSEFEHLLIKDIERERFMDCTVEVLHVALRPEKDLSCIYVTDYTLNDSIPRQDASWSKGLENAVFIIRLYNAQAKMAERVEVGCYYKIGSLQVKRSSEGSYQGRLGGDGRHISKMHAGSSDPRLRELLRRKQHWQSCEERVSSSSSKEFSTLGQVRMSVECPRKFKVLARIVDFYPLKLDKCFFFRCMHCHKNLPGNRKGCMDCDDDDDDDSVSCFMRLFFRLQDVDGSTLEVSACDPDFGLLQGFEPADPYEDDGILDDLKTRLEPFLGNLPQVHENIEKNVPLKSDSPFIQCTIYSWPLEGERGTRGYAIMDIKQADED